MLLEKSYTTVFIAYFPPLTDEEHLPSTLDQFPNIAHSSDSTKLWNKSFYNHTPGIVSIADWSKPLGGFTMSRMSGAGGCDVAVAMRDCGISTTSQTHPVC